MTYEVTKTEEQWALELEPKEFAVLRKAGTERAWTGALLDEKREGVYRCRACSNELFRSDTKFDSHCGWPSFFAPLAGDRVELITKAPASGIWQIDDKGAIRLVLGAEGQQRTVFADTVAGGDELRIFLDASLVEVYRHGSVPTTLRAYPGPGEEWQLELPHGAAADVWELRHPE